MQLKEYRERYKAIAGVDEAGRGPLAGPVVAAAVILPDDFNNQDIKDSKQLSAKKREYLFDLIKAEAKAWSIVAVGPRRIELHNIRAASLLAMSLAVSRTSADFVLIDGNAEIKTKLPQEAIIKGDQKFQVISAASILAKVHRDRLMQACDQRYPGYNFSKHAGYPTKKHRETISQMGPCRIHRKTFKGVQEWLPTQ